MPVFLANLVVSESKYEDIQIWTDAPTPGLDQCRSLRYVCYIDQGRFPLFLISLGPFRVYSGDASTEKYFGSHLAAYKSNTGLLTKSENEGIYMVFFTDEDLAVWCFVVDFDALNQLQGLNPPKDENVFYPAGARAVSSRSDTTIFDRVLENKVVKKQAQPVQTRPPLMSLLILTTSHQISQTVSKMVLSGLRLRGLSVTAAGSSNEKVAVREIYHMTRKAAMFTLRKFNYEFNGSKGQDIRMEDIQDVVERLLEVFLDVDTSRETFRSTENMHGMKAQLITTTMKRHRRQ